MVTFFFVQNVKVDCDSNYDAVGFAALPARVVSPHCGAAQHEPSAFFELEWTQSFLLTWPQCFCCLILWAAAPCLGVLFKKFSTPAFFFVQNVRADCDSTYDAVGFTALPARVVSPHSGAAQHEPSAFFELEWTQCFSLT